MHAESQKMAFSTPRQNRAILSPSAMLQTAPPWPARARHRKPCPLLALHPAASWPARIPAPDRSWRAVDGLRRSPMKKPDSAALGSLIDRLKRRK